MYQYVSLLKFFTIHDQKKVARATTTSFAISQNLTHVIREWYFESYNALYPCRLHSRSRRKKLQQACTGVKAYIAGPLFNDAEKAFNLKLDALIQSLGIQTYLPQRDGGESIRMIREGQQPERVRRRLFELDVSQVKACDLFICILNGRVPDEGTCVELGMAYILGKECIGYQTDSRRFALDYNNLMIENALNGGLALTLDQLSNLVKAATQRLTDHIPD